MESRNIHELRIAIIFTSIVDVVNILHYKVNKFSRHQIDNKKGA